MATPINTRLRYATFDYFTRIHALTETGMMGRIGWTDPNPPKHVIYIKDGGFPYRAVDRLFQPMTSWLTENNLQYVYSTPRLGIFMANDDFTLFKLRWL